MAILDFGFQNFDSDNRSVSDVRHIFEHDFIYSMLTKFIKVKCDPSPTFIVLWNSTSLKGLESRQTINSIISRFNSREAERRLSPS